MSEQARRQGFITRYTKVREVPGLAPVRLHLADELAPIWEMTEEQLGEAGVDPPFWAFAWAGGQAVARYVLDHPIEVRGMRVLDLATGSGLVAIAAALAGAADVLAADIDPWAATAAQLNARLNDVRLATTTEDLLAGPAPAVDVVLAGDVCYEHGMSGAVLGWLRAAAVAGVRVLVGDPGRRYLPASGLDPLARYTVPTSPEVEESEWRQASVFRVRG